MSEAWDREMECKRRAWRIQRELESALAAMPAILEKIDGLSFEYGTTSPADEVEGLLERLEPVTSRIVEIARRYC